MTPFKFAIVFLRLHSPTAHYAGEIHHNTHSNKCLASTGEQYAKDVGPAQATWLLMIDYCVDCGHFGGNM